MDFWILIRAPCLTWVRSQYRMPAASGVTFDANRRRLFVLDSAGRRIVRLNAGRQQDFDGRRAARDRRIVTRNLGQGLDDVRGLAFNPANGHLYSSSSTSPTLYELDEKGKVLVSQELPDREVIRPMAMAFAPSSDRTDSQARMNLLVVTDNELGGEVRAWSFAPTTALPQVEAPQNSLQLEPELSASIALAVTEVGTLVQIIDTSAFMPPSPDPAGIAYIESSDRLLVSDSEVNEIPRLFADANLFEMNLLGVVSSTFDAALTAPAEGLGLAAVLKQTGLVSSTSDAMRMLKQGAVKIDGERVEDPKRLLAPGAEHVIAVGKRRVRKVKVEQA